MNINLSEIYSAIQGEGPLVGVRQIFVRLCGCDLRCVWCDTPKSLIKTEYCEYEEKAGLRQMKKIKNPIKLDDFTGIFTALNPAFHHSVSFTGGEPLIQTGALLQMINQIKNKFFIPIYLETGGHRPEKLLEIIHLLDYVSMDFKLPSSSKTNPLWDEHEKFLSICVESENLKNVWVKVVLTDETNPNEIIKAMNIVQSLNSKYLRSSKKPIEIIIQPVTEENGVKAPTQEALLNISSILLEHYQYIRVLPQVHKLICQK